jgi:predicted RNA-binding protein with PIN domain
MQEKRSSRNENFQGGSFGAGRWAAGQLSISFKTAGALRSRMALIRILVDGYSLLHGWPELAPQKARFSAEAREELVRVLTLYQDAVRTPITVFFDGSGSGRGPKTRGVEGEVEILYSRAGQTADQLIERAAHRFRPFGEVLAVTDDHAERDTVIAMGGSAASCGSFIQSVLGALADLEEDIRQYNQKERTRFGRRTL